MGTVHEGAVVGHIGNVFPAGTKVQPGRSGTLDTSAGPIAWKVGDDASVSAEGAGQQLTITVSADGNGSWARRSAYALTGGGTYLTIDAALHSAERSATATIRGHMGDVSHKGSFHPIPHLTLTLTNIDAAVRSATATVSGKSVIWTGAVDLTSNPLTGKPVPGWPQGAFAAELQRAGFFAPLGAIMAGATQAAPLPGKTTVGSGGGHVMENVAGVVGRAGSWCVGGVIAGSGAGPETVGMSMLLGCVGGATASLASDLVTWADESGVLDQLFSRITIPTVFPIPDPSPPALPPDPGSDPVTQTPPDDPLPPPPSDGDPDPGPQSSVDPNGGGDVDPNDGGDGGGGGGGGGKKIDDEGPVEEKA
jgi:hypothetical protein